jgi:cardiolipin synthase C
MRGPAGSRHFTGCHELTTRKGLLLLVCLLLSLTAGCATALPKLDLPYQAAIAESAETPLGRHVAQQNAAPGLSGFRLIKHGSNALAIRLQMIEAAQDSLDLQYYIYASDRTGALFAEKLLAAADRGVRVRLLLDDIGNSMADFRVAALAEHPNIHIRLFNPTTFRHPWLRYVSKVTEFGRINHRMHNKLMVVDSQMYITGGRNIGDEYYALTDRYFQDLDVLGIGAVTAAVVASFDEYWNSHKSVPIRRLAGRQDDDALEQLRGVLERIAQLNAGSSHMQAVHDSPYNDFPDGMPGEWHWGVAEWIYDPPEKADPHDPQNSIPHVGRSLSSYILGAETELLLMTPYLIPGAQGETMLMRVAERVDLRILTNSLATTDVLAVHGNYAPYRHRLLRGGVQLWELKPVAGQEERARAFFNESVASLHAKSFVFDRDALFIGSINLDPRSININTESGVLIRQPKLAAELAELFELWTSEQYAYRLDLNAEGELRWSSEEGVWTSEPEASRLRRFGAWMIRWLPIEDQL